MRKKMKRLFIEWLERRKSTSVLFGSSTASKVIAGATEGPSGSPTNVLSENQSRVQAAVANKGEVEEKITKYGCMPPPDERPEGPYELEPSDPNVIIDKYGPGPEPDPTKYGPGPEPDPDPEPDPVKYGPGPEPDPTKYGPGPEPDPDDPVIVKYGPGPEPVEPQLLYGVPVDPEPVDPQPLYGVPVDPQPLYGVPVKPEPQPKYGLFCPPRNKRPTKKRILHPLVVAITRLRQRNKRPKINFSRPQRIVNRSLNSILEKMVNLRDRLLHKGEEDIV